MAKAACGETPLQGARALPFAAVPGQICVALWAEICVALGLRSAGGLPAALTARGWLMRAGSDLVWAGDRRAALEEGLAARDPVGWRRTHELCAAFFERRGAEGDLALAVEHRLAIGDRPAAEAVLARWGLAAIEGRWAPSLSCALGRMTGGDAPSPGFVLYLSARVLERRGDLAGALSAYDCALGAGALPNAKEVFGRPPRWLPAPELMAAQAGMLAVRSGQLQLAARWLAEARRLSGQGKGSRTGGSNGGKTGRPRAAKSGIPRGARSDSPRGTPAAVEHLAARVSLGRGDLAAAARSFRRAARAAARAGDAAEEAEALSGLGVMAMRAGDPRRAAELYGSALACAGPGDARIARIQANLAMALACIGRFSPALRLFEEAARVRERLGDLAGVANSLAACAGPREGLGDPDGAWADLARARHLAAMVGDPALLLEIHLLRANLAVRRGEHQVALAEHRAARGVRASLEEPDPLLDAMMEETAAEIALASRQHASCAASARRALGIAGRHGAAYLAARVRLLFARNALAANLRASALRHLSAVARAAVPLGYRFPSAWASARLFEVGFAHGDADARALCAEMLGRAAGAPPRSAGKGAAPFRIVERSGVRLAQKAEVSRLRLSPPELFVDLPRQRLVSPRGRVSLAGRRVALPLLLAFLEKPDRALDAEQLHREIWGTDRFDDAARTRLKVALSRLRGLVGSGVIETRRTTDATGATRTVFGLAPGVAYRLIDRG